MKKELLIVLLLFLLTIPAVKSLFIPGAYTSHDLTYHIMRQISIDRLLTEGQFPPRWDGVLNNGYGYPVFIFNYQLPAFIGEVFVKLGFGFVNSVKAVFVISMFLSVLGMYLFLRKLLGSKLGAFLGAVFFIYAPIRFINLYVSASIGAAFALGILPFVFYFITSLIKDEKKKTINILLGSLAFGLLVLSHNFTTFIFAPIIAIFTILLLKEKKKRVFDLGMMFVLGLGLSVWFWLPAIAEKQYIRYDQFYEGFYKDHFINLQQLLRSPWGYGLSHPQNPGPGDMSYQLGLIHILIIGILVPIVWIFRNKKEVKIIGGFSLIFFFLSTFLMLKISTPIWELFKLDIIQFPLRLSAVAIFSASLATGVVIKYIPYQKLSVLVFLLLVLYANRNHWKINEVFNPGEDYYLSLKGVTSPYGEDLPKWGKTMSNPAPSKFEFVDGSGIIKYKEDKSAKVVGEVEATQAGKIRFNQFYFPNWEIKVNDKKVDFSYLTEGESYGMMLFDIEKGKHQITAEFKGSFVRNLADFASIASVVIWVGILCRLLLRRQ